MTQYDRFGQMAIEDLQGLLLSDLPDQHPRQSPSIKAVPPSPTFNRAIGPYIDFERLQEVLHFQKQVRKFRQDILVERVKLREDRNALSERRRYASEAAAKYTAAVRTAQDGGRLAARTELRMLYENVLKTRDAYGEAETEYNQQEAKYYDQEHSFNSKEWKLSKLEDELFGFLEDAKTDDPARARSASFPSERSREQPIIMMSSETEEMTLLEEYRSQLGTAEMLKERLGDLSLEQTEQLEAQRERKALNLDIDPANQDFLDQFRELYDQTWEELQAVFQKAQILREKLLYNGYDPDNQRRGPSDPDPPYPLTPVPATPRSRSPAKSDSAVARMLGDFIITRQRIGEWILSNLRSSPIERARHKAALNDESLDNEEWWNLVKEFWNQDAMAKVDIQSDLESMRLAESYSFRQSAWSVELEFADEISSIDATLSAMFGGQTERPETAASHSTQSSSTYPSTQLTSATNPTSVTFGSKLSSNSLPREARIHFDDEGLESVKTIWDRAESSFERKMEQDLNLRGALPYWSSLSRLESCNNSAASPPAAPVVLVVSKGN